MKNHLTSELPVVLPWGEFRVQILLLMLFVVLITCTTSSRSTLENATGQLDKVYTEFQVKFAGGNPPELIHCPEPELPPGMQLQRTGLGYVAFANKGSVHLSFVVDKEGGVEWGVTVLESSHKKLESRARDLIRKCRFQPGRVNGVTVRVRMEHRVVFKIT